MVDGPGECTSKIVHRTKDMIDTSPVHCSVCACFFIDIYIYKVVSKGLSIDYMWFIHGWELRPFNLFIL